MPHFNIPLLYQKPFIVTIHDILWHQVKGPQVTTLNPLTYNIKHMGYKKVMKHAVTNSQHIIVPSFWVKEQLENQYPYINNSKVKVIYEAVDPNFSTKSPTKSSKQSNPYVIYTGSAYPHKNLKTLVDAIVILKDKQINIDLHIVSSRSVFLDKIANYIRSKNAQSYVKILGRLSDQSLKGEYSSATALVHPSLSEGFGLTGLEAMHVGLPVISSNKGSLPEIYQDAALYVDPQKSTDIANSIHQVSTDTALKKKLIKLGKARSNQFSWASTAKKTLELYNSSKQ